MILTNLLKNRGFLQAQVLVEELVRHGVNTFFVAPGSRSTPLVAAIALHSKTNSVIHFDERGGSFAALGFARATGRAAAWVTTSGTAVANGFPAIVEASLDDVPMVLLTADRPSELRNAGANQTIDQLKIFGGYVRSFFDLPSASDHEKLQTTVRVVSQAMQSLERNPGPIHLNCPFREPFVSANETSVALQGDEIGDLKYWFESGDPLTSNSKVGLTMPHADAIDSLRALVARHDRGLVVIGSLPPDAPLAVISGMVANFGWPILVDPLSQLRNRSVRGPAIIHYYDQLLAVDRFASEADPDVIVHIGGRLVSKSLLAVINRRTDSKYVRIGSQTNFNPGQRTCSTVYGDVTLVLAQIKPVARTNDEWFRSWSNANSLVDDLFLQDSVLTGEPLAARQLVEGVPHTCALFVGNSMPIRDVDRYAIASESIEVYANRGASGIDGLIATACGIAAGRQGPVTALLGDLAMLHDINSLALVKRSSFPVILVVINNDGGGIFSFLPIAEQDAVFDEYFGTPHGMTFDGAASQFNLPYRRITDASQLGDHVRNAIADGASQIIEVESGRVGNRVNHDRITKLVEMRLGL